MHVHFKAVKFSLRISRHLLLVSAPSTSNSRPAIYVSEERTSVRCRSLHFLIKLKKKTLQNITTTIPILTRTKNALPFRYSSRFALERDNIINSSAYRSETDVITTFELHGCPMGIMDKEKITRLSKR